MQAYRTQEQIMRRSRRNRKIVGAVVGSVLLAAGAAMTSTSAGNKFLAPMAIAAAEKLAGKTMTVVADAIEAPASRQVQSRGNIFGPVTAVFAANNAKNVASGGNAKASDPSAVESSASNPGDPFAGDPYAAAVAANRLSSQSNSNANSGAVQDDSGSLKQTQPVDTTTEPVVAEGVDNTGRVELGVNRTTVIKTNTPYTRVSVGQPDVADVNPIGPNSILVTAKKAGSTQLIIWDNTEKSQTIDVVVGMDLETLRQQISRTFPTAKVEVEALNGTLSLRGSVGSIETAQQIVAMASPFSDKVLNFLEVSGGQQVMLQVKFLEMSRRATQELGINLSASLSNSGNFDATFNGPAVTSKASNPAISNLVGSATWDSFTLNYALAALKQNNLARVLAEPNVTVISGQEASMLAGGEFPVPVPQTGTGGGSTITIEYREFGVRLNVTPVVMGDGRIRLKVAPEVSDLDFSSPVVIENNSIPIINKRKVQSTVEMLDGQTFAIAGLMRNTVTASRNATPLLGELPIIGALFRSVRYQREETELVVLVTPSIVEPLNPGEIPSLPGESWRHPNPVEFYLNGDFGKSLESKKHAEKPDRMPARFRGDYGFAPTEEQTASVER